MKELYIVLTSTGTILSRIIKFYTKDRYSHISIALDENLKGMYSFGRLNPYNAFIGGFVQEGIDIGTFKRFKNTRTEIYVLKGTDEQYEKASEIIRKMNKMRERYKFNIIGLFLAGFNKRLEIKDSFYCAEFVKYVLSNSDVKNVKNLPLLIKPEDFKKLEGLELIYTGLLCEYKSEEVKQK